MMLERETGIHTLVGEYYEARILMGDQDLGDHLPSLAKLCAIFHLAPATVRTGLELLERKGYIQIEARKAPRVVYAPERSAKRELAARYFAARRRDIADLVQAGQILFEPLWQQGMAQLSAQDWQALRQALAQPSEEMLSLPVQFYIQVLGTYDNELLLNLYGETIRYIRFPYLEEPTSQAFRQLAQADDAPEVIAAKLQLAFAECFGQALEKLWAFLEQVWTEYDLDAEPEVPFHWNVYRPRPQLCYSLVAQIISHIGSGAYACGTFLPAQPEMAREWGVSVSTVRRALKILGELGLVQSYQGKGTVVLAQVTAIDFGSAEVREGLRYYRESIALLRLTFARSAQAALAHADEAAKASFVQAFFDWIAQGKSYAAFDGVLAFVETHCPYRLLKECYRRLRELLTWGYAFTCYRLKGRDLHDTYFAVIEQAAERLAAQDEKGFIDAWLSVLDYEAQKLQELLTEEAVTV